MRRLERTIEEIGWTREIPRLAPTEMVAIASDLMRRDAHDCVLITTGDQLDGIFTSRDFLNRVVAAGANPTLTPLAGVMTRTPRTLKPRDRIVFAINWMAVEGYRNVPIVDDAGALLGVLTIWDVMRHLDEIFAEIDATPRDRLPQTDTSGVVAMIDIGGDS